MLATLFCRRRLRVRHILASGVEEGAKKGRLNDWVTHPNATLLIASTVYAHKKNSLLLRLGLRIVYVQLSFCGGNSINTDCNIHPEDSLLLVEHQRMSAYADGVLLHSSS